MKRLKALGVALVAVFSMAAMMASAAQATESTTTLTSNAGRTSVVGTVEASSALQEFGVNTGLITCPVVRIPEKTISVPTETGEVHPEFLNSATVNCKAFGFKATVVTNKCNFLFHLISGVAGQAKGTASVTIVGCEAGSPITITNVVTKCVITVGNQTVGEHVVFDNEGAGASADLKLTADINTAKANGILTYTETGSECAKNGVTSTNGKYVGNTTVRAFEDVSNKEGAGTGILID